MFPFRFLAVALALGLVATLPARAHEPFEITADARPRAEGLELRLTLAWSTTMRACHGGKAPDPWIPPEDFDRQRARIEKHAAGFFVVTADHEPLAVRDMRVQLTVENDIEIVLLFNPPAAGTVRFHAAMLHVLPREGYGSQFTILARDGAFLGQETLWPDKPSFELSAAALR